LDELKGVLTNLMSRLELAKAALAKKVEKPKMVAAKVEGTFPDLPWGGAQLLAVLLRAVTTTAARHPEGIPAISASHVHAGLQLQRLALLAGDRVASAEPSPSSLLFAGDRVDANKVRAYLEDQMQKRIMVIDGAMGTTIQQYKFSEADFRGEPLLTHSTSAQMGL
jgi:hypothetical protein